jgi:hypothetical protein
MKRHATQLIFNRFINRPVRYVPDLRSRQIVAAGREAQRDWDIVERPDFGERFAR